MELRYNGSGKVYYCDNEYCCDLYLNNILGGVLLKINIRDEHRLSSYLKIPLEIDYLCGELNTGFKFALFSLHSQSVKHLISYGKTEYTYIADYILYGIGKRKDNLEQEFTRVEYTLTDILKWGEDSAFIISNDHGLYVKKECIEKVLFSNNEYTIKYLVRCSMLPIVNSDLLRDNIEIQQKGIIEICYNSKQRLHIFIKLFEKVKSLIETAIFSRINIEAMSAYSDELVDKYGENVIERKIKIYGKGIKEIEKEKKENVRQTQWLSCNELISLNSFDKYFNSHEKLAPILELLLEPLYINNISNSRIFLNAVQALETYHSRFVSNNIADFKLRIDHLVEGQTDEVKEKNINYFMANSKMFITLESRIADLLKANWKIHFDTGEISHEDFPSVIAHTRNYYIHYDEGIKTKYRILDQEELPFYTMSLLKILDYYILLELGYSEDGTEIHNKINNRWGNISKNLQILRLSKKKKIISG